MIRLNTYENWYNMLNGDPNAPREEKLAALARYNCIQFTEYWEAEDINPTAVLALNPYAQCYRLYALCVKPVWDWDSRTPPLMQFPFTMAEIDANNWHLLDGNGDPFWLGDEWAVIDVGIQGFAQAYAERVQERLAGRGFAGLCFDYWQFGISSWFAAAGKPMPQKYPTDADWFNLAWQPFISHVCGALRSAGYRIIGNSAGEYTDTRPEVLFQRAWCDGTVYEQFAFDYEGQPQPLGRLQSLLQCLAEDPLEVWVAELGIRQSLGTWTPQKRLLSLALYYVGLPALTGLAASRSYHHYGDGGIFWDPYWDMEVGGLAAIATQERSGVWVRTFDNGMVAVNTTAQELCFCADREYSDHEGRACRGAVRVPAGSGAVLWKPW